MTVTTYPRRTGIRVETVNVKNDFGAVGDGVADDTAAINAWLTYIVANDKIGYVPAGTYRFTSALTGGVGSNWGIVGEGSAAVTFLYDGANTSNDIWTIGDGIADLINVKLSGFKLKSDTVMTAGIGLHIKRLCRSIVYDVTPDGQDGNGNLWHGIWFDELDNVTYDKFEIRAQQDGLRISGGAGAVPKADLNISHYKIASCDVGIRVGGAFGGLYMGEGSIAVCGDGVVIDNTIVAEANREVFFAPTMAIDACSRCGVVIDQAISSQLWVSIPAHTWIASCTSHGVWIKNASGAKVAIDAYIYNITGDGIRIDDASSFVEIGNPIFNTITGYGINPTVNATNLRMDAPRYIDVTNTFNFTAMRAAANSPFPISVQSGRAIYWLNFTGTLDGAGAATFAHSLAATEYTKAVQIAGACKSAGAWLPLTITHMDGTNIGVSGGVAAMPYNVMVFFGDEANPGW
jgi:hypothetical protein